MNDEKNKVQCKNIIITFYDYFSSESIKKKSREKKEIEKKITKELIQHEITSK